MQNEPINGQLQQYREEWLGKASHPRLLALRAQRFTQEEVAQIFGITRQWVQKVEAQYKPSKNGKGEPARMSPPIPVSTPEAA
jgi:hypothetical protein